MSIELDKIPLIKQKRDDETGKTKLLNSVHNLKVEDKRSVVEHKIPGMEGGVLQDLGREPVQISFEGVIHGEEAKELLKNIRSKFKSGEAVPFASDLSGVADVTDVVIADLEYNEISGSPNSHTYSVTLKEYKPPPEKDEPAPSQEEEVDSMIMEEVSGIRVRTDDVGVVVKADALGTLEAIVEQLKNRSVKVRIADVGDVSKRDIIDAEVVGRKDPLLGVVFAFNLNVAPDARDYSEEKKIKLIESQIIFEMFEEYQRWKAEWQERELDLLKERVVTPCKLRIMPGYVFRQSKPAICGVQVLSGQIRPRRNLVNEQGIKVGRVREIQLESKNVDGASEGMEVAVSIEGAVVGRNIREDEELFADIPEEDAKVIEEKLKQSLTPSEIETFKEFVSLKRQEDLFWGR